MATPDNCVSIMDESKALRSLVLHISMEQKRFFAEKANKKISDHNDGSPNVVDVDYSIFYY